MKTILTLIFAGLIMSTSVLFGQSATIVAFEKTAQTLLPFDTVKVRTAWPVQYGPYYTIYCLQYSDNLVTWQRVPSGHPLCGKVEYEYVGEDTFLTYSINSEIDARFFRLAPFLPTQITLNRDLTLGMSGDDVADLQVYLQQLGYLYIPETSIRGYFVESTKSALAAFQSDKGISPAEGYLGPLTRAYIMGHPNG